MAALKCKMCGGDLELTPDVTVAECPYCGTKQTVPNADNEKKMTLFTRANRLRFNCEFDKAAGVYETIIAEFPEEAESYWGLLLCKYGIEYVDDPATGKKIPTCHRSSFDSVMEDENFELATEYADAVAKKVYREEAKQIEEIRKGIIEVSVKEEPYDIFICYKETDENGGRTIDSVLAQDIYDALTEKGYRVFFSRITLEDKLGQEYEPYIFATLHSARVMLAVGTSYEHYDAVWVKNEWSRYLQLMAAGEKKALIPCYKNLDAYDMPKEFAKLQAQDMGKVGALQDLLRGVDKIIGKGVEKTTVAVSATTSGMEVLNAQTASLLKRGYMALEDSDFEKADKFFEQVLNNDAECGQAYLGKMLVDYKAEDINAFIDKWFCEYDEFHHFGEWVFPPEVDFSELARKADAKTGILSGFSDEELNWLMKVEFQTAPIKHYDRQLAYEEELSEWEHWSGEDNGRNFERVKKYADEWVCQKICLIQEEMKKRFEARIQKEKSKKENFIKNCVEKQEREKKEIERTVTEWLEKAGTVREKLKKEAEERVKAAEEKAEKEYRAAEEAYNTVIAKQSELRGKIAQLEQEKSELRGSFSGKKRKELEENIAWLRIKLNTLIVPQAPGERPIQENLPVHKSFSKSFSGSSSTDDNIEKLRIEATVFPSVRALLEQIEDIKTASVGDKVYFGHYPQTAAGEVQKLQWRVLEKRNGSALLLTEKGIGMQAYHEEFKDITWEHCTLRKWLNEEFINRAFGDKILIQDTRVDNSKVQGDNEHETDGGNDTLDKVFLLSYKEAGDYFTSNKTRICVPTAYAHAMRQVKLEYEFKLKDEDEDEDADWWLRSPGYSQDSAFTVSTSGRCFENLVDDEHAYVRPALWVNLESNIF